MVVYLLIMVLLCQNLQIFITQPACDEKKQKNSRPHVHSIVSSKMFLLVLHLPKSFVLSREKTSAYGGFSTSILSVFVRSFSPFNENVRVRFWWDTERPFVLLIHEVKRFRKVRKHLCYAGVIFSADCSSKPCFSWDELSRRNVFHFILSLLPPSPIIF